MTTDKTTSGEPVTDLTVTTSGETAGHDLAEQYWTTMARTADLVRKLTSLADRYDAVPDGDPRVADGRQRVAMLRTTAESGRRLIRSLVPPALPPEEQPHVSRPLALVTKLEKRAIVRQAQGVLMERAGVTAGEALEALSLAATGPMTLDLVAEHVVRWRELPPSVMTTGSPRPERPTTHGERWRDAGAEGSTTVLAAVIEHAGLGLALFAPDGVAFQANPAFCRMLGCTEGDLLSMRFTDYTHADDVEHDEARFAQMLAGGSDVYRVEKRYLRQDGGVVWGVLTMSAVRGSDGGLQFAVGMVEDVTAERRLREDLQHQALHDHLTGLPNRRLFDDRFAHAQRIARRREHGLAVIVLDLDGFKTVNDTLGHAAGDEVLVAVAATLAAACRDSDTVARVGGDEFAVLCEGPGAVQHARALAERLRTALDVTLVLRSGARAAVSASVGFAVAEAAEEDDTLLRRADEAMYRAKEREVRGRGA